MILSGTGTLSAMVYIVTSSPSTDASGRRKCLNAALMAIHEASMRPPSASRTWTSALTDQHLAPAIMQRDSVSMELDRRMAFSRIRERIISDSVCLPTSNEGEAIGFSSVTIVKTPSNFRSSDGLVTSADI